MMMVNSMYLNLCVGHRQPVQTMIKHLSHRFSHTNICALDPLDMSEKTFKEVAALMQ